MSDIGVLVRSIKKLEDDAKALKAEADELRAELRDLVEPGNYDVDEYEVIVSSNRRFNPKKAMHLVKDFDDDAYEQVVEDAINKKAFEALYPDLYAAAQDEGALRITIKEADNLD